MGDGSVIAYAGLGANLGAAVQTLELAVGRMDLDIPGVRVAARSRVYHSAPVGPPDQPWYANMAVALACGAGVTPDFLFAGLMTIERELGRNRILERRFGPRFIDIDLLAFGRERRNTAELILPHPRMMDRAFVLVPLAEIAPDAHPLPDGLPFAAHGTIIVQTGP